MSSDSAVIESNSAFSETALTPRYQTTATPATHHVETSGVRWRGEIDPNRAGSAARRAIDSPVRDAGMIVVCVEAIAEGATASSTTQPPATPAPHHVETSGVRWRGEIDPNRAGSAARRAIDSPVRDAGMIVVCVEAIAEVATASSTTQSQPPSTWSDSSANTASSSSAFAASQLVPAKQTTATATPR